MQFVMVMQFIGKQKTNITSFNQNNSETNSETISAHEKCVLCCTRHILVRIIFHIVIENPIGFFVLYFRFAIFFHFIGENLFDFVTFQADLIPIKRNMESFLSNF